MKKIFIVEDEPTLLHILFDKFSDVGFQVFSAINGKDGLDLALKNHPDTILLDIIMPVMDGMTMLEKLREDSWGKKARVILLTNLSDAEKVVKSSRQGVYDYLIKCDMTIDEVIERVIKKSK